MIKKLYRKIRSVIINSANKSANPSKEVSKLIGGHKYAVKEYHTTPIKLDANHESWLDAVLKAALETKKGAFIDVGVNCGQTLIKLLSIDRDRQYIGFEPQLECAFFVDDFIKSNGLKSHTVLPLGLSDRSETVKLQKRGLGKTASASMVVGFRPDSFYSTEERIYVAPGDNILSTINLSGISIVKVDVEGGELEVITGLKETIKKHRPFVFFEVLNNFLRVTGRELDEKTIVFRERRVKVLEDLLRGLDYTIFNIVPEQKIQEVEKIQPVVSDDPRIVDYVAVPRSVRETFASNFAGSVT